ncbi:hypothetical protein EBV26_08815 [bacterium]|nr:hypothetical protein [bacterium]
MSLEQTIRDTVMSESMDLDGRLQQLVRAGLMPSNTLPLLRKAIAKVQGGMSLQGPERDVMATFINSMMYIVLGDDTIFNKARAGAKNYATEEVDMGQAERGMRSSSRHTGGYHVVDKAGKVVSKHANQRDAMQAALKNDDHRVKAIKEDTEELDENAKVAAHLIKRYGDNVRKSHVRSAANDFGVGYVALSHAVRKKLGVNRLEEENVDEAVGDYTVKTVSPADAWKKHTGQRTSKSKVPVDPKTGKTLYQKVTSEETEELEEGWGVKVNGFSKWKEGIQDWADNHTHNGKVDIQTKKVGAGGKEWHQTIASHKGVRVGHFNHDGAGKSETGHGTHAHFSDNVHEQVDQIDELSRELVGRYARRAKDEADYGNPLKSRSKGRMLAQQKRWGGSSSYVKPARVPATEEVEQIDELSKKTLGNYVKKAAGHAAGSAAATAAIASSSNPKVPEKTKRDLRNRMTGISKAADKLTKEETDIQERDEGKPGKMFAKIAAKAAKKYGSKEAGNRVAGAIRKKVLAKEDIEAVKSMNESYKTAFDAALIEYNIKSPSELDESKRKEFFQFVDQEFKKGDQ